MSEKELKFERKSKIVVAIPFVILISVLLFMSSCASSNYQTCAAYASIECENCDEID